MTRSYRHFLSTTCKVAHIAAAMCTITMAGEACAQNIASIQTPSSPLVLQSRGSFYVGGEVVEQSAVELGSGPLPDVATVNQMYVEYMIPDGTKGVPIIMIHGAGLSGKSYDTTPDGRMGWFEYFTRKSHPSYVVDQVGRARSGFNQAALNRRLSGSAPSDTSSGAFRFGTTTGVWTNFRFGPRYAEAFRESQFPTAAAAELAKQGIPDMRAFVPAPNPTYSALAELANDLKGAALVSHSQSGHFPMEAALLNPAGIKAIVALEPGRCGDDLFSDEQIAKLAKIPTLVIFGDYLPAPTGFSSVTWQDRLDGCKAYAKRIKAAGGVIDLVETPSLGVRGNSHMLMQDRNNDQIADYILGWIDAKTASKTQAPVALKEANGAAALTTGSWIWKKGSPPVTSGPASNFTGRVQVVAPYKGTGGSRLGGATVKFEAGARSAWHRHPMGQTLIVTEGCGWTQAEGGPIEKICAGDVAWIGPGEKHWHGATDTTSMTHVTASESVEGQSVEWLEKVPDHHYSTGPR